MGIFKRMLSLLAFLPAAAAVWSCGEGPDPGGPGPMSNIDIRREAFELLDEKFEAGVSLDNFAVRTEEISIGFGDGSYLFLPTGEFETFTCRPDKWPGVAPNLTGEWVAGDINTGVTLDTEECLVALVYDGEGLYAHCSSGRILFFHAGPPRRIGCFRFEAALNPWLGKDMVCHVEGSAVTAVMPGGVPVASLKATVACRGRHLSLEGVPHVNGAASADYSMPLTMDFIGFDETPQQIAVDIMADHSIPIIRITTENGAQITSKEDYIKAAITVEDREGIFGQTDVTGPLVTEIRGRGNTTWEMPKKPYKIKLDKKAALLGMSTDKEWALLAGYSDKSLMRNYVAFELSRMAGMPWTPLVRPVELYLNGRYDGAYLLTEQVKVSPERVNVSIVGGGDNAGEALTGGYFLEMDTRYDGDAWFDTSRGYAMVFKEPKTPTQAQLAYVKGYFDDFEAALYGAGFKDPANGYAKYVDVPSFVANYLVQELAKNIDGNLRLSTFISKSRSGKLTMSNVWDFDIALGNANYFYENGPYSNGPTEFYIKNFRWYRRMFEDPAFVAEVKREWSALYAGMDDLLARIDLYYRQTAPAAGRNFERWNILGRWVWPNVEVKGSYKAEVEYLKWFLTERAKWLDGQIKNLNS